ncbi:hypothetical protein, partial [Klebsiella pneumoniae]|uniref:hypothetical protein n=1 Tax=Klebsiella pneumoniae TaxID=573 RepID=UPI003CC909A2
MKYAIQPVSQLNYSQFHEGQIVPVIGCGPFEVQEHTRNKLKLKAFSQFYGCRALTDRVTIWQVDEERLSRPLIETNQPEANTTS